MFILKNINIKLQEIQHEIIQNKFENWKGSEEQVDDVLVLGIRL